MKYLYLAIAAIAVAVLGYIAKETGFLALLSDVQGLQAWISSFGALSYIVFVLVFVAACVFMLPGSAFTIVAGIAFGPIAGAILSLLAATAGATAAFIVARFLMRGLILNKFGENPIFKKIDDGVKENGTSFLILTRLVPVFPFSLQNYAYGLTGISLFNYVTVSLLTMAPGAFIYAYMAGDIATNGVSPMLLVKFAVAGLILFGVSLIPKYIARKRGIDIQALSK